MDRAPTIEVSELRKTYGDVVALDGVTFSVEPGEVVGFLGPNGAGKTTTMKILTGFISATEGSARVAGFEAWCQLTDQRPPLADALAFIAEKREQTGQRITITHLVGKAVAQALEKEPTLNGRITFGRFVPHDTVDVTYLVSLDGGNDLALGDGVADFDIDLDQLDVAIER